MRKVRIDTRHTAHGSYQYVKWWQPGGPGRKGRERSRCFSGRRAKKLAQGYAARLFHELNADIVIDPIRTDWSTLIDLYEDYYRVRGQTDEARYQAVNTLNHFARLVGNPDSTLLTQQHLDAFLVARQGEVRPFTVNKDVANLRAFLGWAKAAGYLRGTFRLEKVPAASAQIRALDVDEVRRLLKACPTETWRIRILLSLCTGLRKETIDCLHIGHVDLNQMLLTGAVEQKTRKAVVRHPLPDLLGGPFRAYLAVLAGGPSGRLFQDHNIRKTWDAIRVAAGVNCTRQQLRQTYSTLIQVADGLAASAKLLRHSSAHVTLRWYTDEMLVLRTRVNQLPLAEWLATNPKRKAKS